MKRTRDAVDLGPVHAILTADWHLRETSPICREDDFWKAQWAKVQFVSFLQKKHKCPVIHAGDLFHHWKPSPRLLSWACEYLPEQFWTVYGNHDLPQHSLGLRDRSGIYMLETANRLSVLTEHNGGQSCQQDPPSAFLHLAGCSVLVAHIGVWKGKSPWPGCTNPTAEQMLEDNPKADLIVTGDFHTPLVESSSDGRLLVNPGNLTRQTADQFDFRPRVYLWHGEANQVSVQHIPIEPGVVSRGHLEVQQQRDARMGAFVAKLNQDWEAELSFEHNLKQFFSANDVPDTVRQVIFRAIQEGEA